MPANICQCTLARIRKGNVKILWVKAGGLVPLDLGGKIRSFQIMKALSRKHAITFLTYYQQHTHDQHKELENLFDRVICLPLSIPDSGTLRDRLRYAKNLFTWSPYALNKYKDRNVARHLKNLVLIETYDVLIADFCVGGVNFPWKTGRTKILFTHNAEAEIWRQQYENANSLPWKLVAWREWKTMRRQETAYARRADHIFTVSQHDKEYFSRFLDTEKITAIPTGVDTEYFHPSGERENSNSIVFTGAMDWKPNEDAVLYFSAEILPRLASQIPDLTFWIVGRNPSERVKALGTANSRIRVTGRVDDVRPYVQRAAVCVVPLRIGSGTRMKIFEAMACGKPVVSTSIGAQGLPVTNGYDIELADEPAPFADRVAELCANPAKRSELGRQARDLVSQHYGWQTVGDQIGNLLEQICHSRAEGHAIRNRAACHSELQPQATPTDFLHSTHS